MSSRDATALDRDQTIARVPVVRAEHSRAATL